MKKFLLISLVLSFLTICLCIFSLTSYAAPPFQGTQTLRSENGNVNIETGSTGDIQLSTNNTRHWTVDGTTGALSSPDNSALKTSVIPPADGNSTLSNLGSSSAGYKNLYMSDGTNRAQLFVSNGLYESYPSGQSLIFRNASTDVWSLLSTGTLAAKQTTNLITTSTADASDNASIEINGGGATGSTRGGSITLYGNEHASTGGIFFTTGQVNGSSFKIFIPATDNLGTFLIRDSNNAADRFSVTQAGAVSIATAGQPLTLKAGGAAATAGTFTCNGVTGVVVSTTNASASMVLAFSPNTISGTAPVGAPYVSAFTAGTSFTVKCSVAGETSVYNWAMIKTN